VKGGKEKGWGGKEWGDERKEAVRNVVSNSQIGDRM